MSSFVSLELEIAIITRQYLALSWLLSQKGEPKLDFQCVYALSSLSLAELVDC